MKDDTIRVGDLVVMVRGHSCLLNRIGGILFTVGEIATPEYEPWCGECGKRYPIQTIVRSIFSVQCLPIAWLKKIPPLGDLEGCRDKRDISVPKTSEHLAERQRTVLREIQNRIDEELGKCRIERRVARIPDKLERMLGKKIQRREFDAEFHRLFDIFVQEIAEGKRRANLCEIIERNGGRIDG